MKYASLFVICCVTLLTHSCSRNELDVDISDVEIAPLEVMRLEHDVFSINKDNVEEKTSAILTKYGPFYDHYLMGFLCRFGTKDSSYRRMILSFTGDEDVRGTYKYVTKLFPDNYFNSLTPELEDCLRRFKLHFPSERVPTRLITATTGWNYSVAYFDSALVLGLDMYMGDTAQYYQMLHYPQYQVRRMNSHYILPDLMRGIILTEFDKLPAENTLLNHAIFYGKVYYAVNAMLPDHNDSLIIGYTGAQMKYCREYEKKLWGYFAEKNRLFENNMNTVRELTTEGPFTAAISKDCPPRIAMWVGWQIVRSYMKNNKDVNLENLMNNHDASSILNRSKYRP